MSSVGTGLLPMGTGLGQGWGQGCSFAEILCPRCGLPQLATLGTGLIALFHVTHARARTHAHAPTHAPGINGHLALSPRTNWARKTPLERFLRIREPCPHVGEPCPHSTPGPTPARQPTAPMTTTNNDPIDEALAGEVQ